MAVAEVSQFIAQIMYPLLSGVYTIQDDDLFLWLAKAWHHAGLKLEPSAAACLGGPGAVTGSADGQSYLSEHGLTEVMANATHVMWATGGSLVPEEEFQAFLQKGEAILR